jgi:hypothetical protein
MDTRSCGAGGSADEPPMRLVRLMSTHLTYNSRNDAPHLEGSPVGLPDHRPLYFATVAARHTLPMSPGDVLHTDPDPVSRRHDHQRLRVSRR